MMEYRVRLFLTTMLSIAFLCGAPTAAVAATDACPTLDGDQAVDICVPPSKPRAKIITICVNEGEGTARIRLKNKGDFWTVTFSIYGAGVYREVSVKPSTAKTVRAKGLREGGKVKVRAHGVNYDAARVVNRSCP